MKKILSLIISITILAPALYSQTDCINCSGTNSSATLSSSAIGKNTSATGFTSFASGYASEATGYYSTALGFYSFATYNSAISIGNAIRSNAYKSIAIGSGSYDHGKYLENNTERSLVVGFNSTKPTFSVREPLNQTVEFDRTGRVAIGNVVNQYGILDPQAKLHIKADQEEPAVVLIEPYNWAEGDAASLVLGNEFHSISAINGKGLVFRTRSNYLFNEGDLVIGREAQPGSVLTCMDELGTVQWQEVIKHWNTLESGDLYYNKGNVAIGTINTYGYRLAVEGKILTDEVMVKHRDEWFDHVFDPTYKLLPLNELSYFVKLNRHLPDVPTQKQVSESGFGLAEMNGILLKKVEELTLYIIEQQEKIQHQDDEIEEIKKHLGL